MVLLINSVNIKISGIHKIKCKMKEKVSTIKETRPREPHIQELTIDKMKRNYSDRNGKRMRSEWKKKEWL